MWNRPVLFLWISVDVRKNRRFRVSFPVAIYSLFGLIDAAEDLLELAGILTINGRIGHKEPGRSLALAKGWLYTSREVLRELVFFTGPVDLVDIDVDEKDGRRVKIKCLLR